MRELVEFTGEFDTDTWHEYFRRRYLPMHEVELPDWSTMLVPMSTASLPMHRDNEDPLKPNWDDYLMAIEKWCAERGLEIEDMQSM